MPLTKLMPLRLVKFQVKGFRSLRDVTWEPGPLDILIGPNASGKTNLLMALELISAGAKGELSDYILRRGGMIPLVWDGTGGQIKLAVTIGPERALDDAVRHEALNYTISLQRVRANYIVHDEAVEFDVQKTSGNEQRLLYRDYTKTEIRADNRRQISKTDNESPRESSLPAAAKIVKYRATGVKTIARHLAAWMVYEELNSAFESKVRQSAVSSHQDVVGHDGENLIAVLHTLYTNDEQFEEAVNQAMTAAFGKDFIKLVFPPDAADQRVQLAIRWRGLHRQVPAADLSSGTLRFLYLIAILANPNPPPLIAIEEPEIGLHPRMLSIVAEFAAEAARRSQVVLTTHSSGILDAFNRFQPTTSVVESENGETRIRNVSGEKLAHWLKGYTLGDLFRSHELETMT